ncbi:hypothetical protein SAMN03159316_3018 [Pseudomonas sp. NFR02]|nr:hypothetical protein SAMN03159316_3018 [Pseudomonas sp. NFR02]
MTSVGAGLPAIAVAQLKIEWLTYRHRERSYRGRGIPLSD